MIFSESYKSHKTPECRNTSRRIVIIGSRGYRFRGPGRRSGCLTKTNFTDEGEKTEGLDQLDEAEHKAALVQNIGDDLDENEQDEDGTEDSLDKFAELGSYTLCRTSHPSCHRSTEALALL